ncbi:Hypothetical predicted protein [Mytilus galloprovincialis]|uniref:Uncharacterized protein n=1 Tax=Mytilus galloprovincialis TaxID=29158 RepID=A0A8B6DTL2_MYTGA|nr:Hypothetical predicted protein [Mytilus galloprovincialis]
MCYTSDRKIPIHIPRLDVTTEEILACGQINMYHYNADKHKGFTSLKFPELQSLKDRVLNNSWQIDALRHVTRQLKSPIPEWSGTMQMFQQGSSTGVSYITFVPMIDLNPSDMSCIYSTLTFISKKASRQGRIPVLTFDQPLYWKSIMITSGEECSNIIVQLEERPNFTLNAKRPSGSNISQQPQVNPQLMFQQLTAVGQDSLNNTAELFEYELSSFPSSLFEANGPPKQAAKATLADAIWNMGDCQAQELPETNIVHVIDGGSLLYRIPWIKGQTFSQICMKYIDHIRKRFSNPTVVMDGYNSSSTKDITHLRRSKGIQSNTITFTRDMPLRIKKETFLLNQSNKQRFVEMLIDTFQEHSIEAIQAKEDADLLIVRTAVEKSNRQEVVIYGEDTDLLILLCHLAEKEFSLHILYHGQAKCDEKFKGLEYTKNTTSSW